MIRIANFFISALLLIAYSFPLLSQERQRLYPAEGEAWKLGNETAIRWGFINAKGEWVKKPVYLNWIDYNKCRDLYFIVAESPKNMWLGSRDHAKDLIVYNGFGDTIRYFPDTMVLGYQDRYYEIKDRKITIIDIENEILYGRTYADSVRAFNASRWVNTSWGGETKAMEPFRKEHINGNTYKLWYATKTYKDLGSLAYLSNDLMLVNIGGYTRGDYHEAVSGKSGCVVYDNAAYYDNLKVEGGQWAVMNSRDEVVYGPVDATENSFKPQNHTILLDYGARKKTLVCILVDRQQRGQKHRVSLLDKNGKMVYDDMIPDSVSCYLEGMKKSYSLKYFRKYREFNCVRFNDSLQPTDTFQACYPDQQGIYAAIKKNGKWGIIRYDGMVMEKPLLDVENPCTVVNEQMLSYPTSDSTLVVKNLHTGTSLLLEATNIQRYYKGYLIAEKRFGKQYTSFLADTNGKILFGTSTWTSINFVDSTWYSAIAGYDEIDEHLIHGYAPIKNRFPVTNAFRVGPYFVEVNHSILDSDFHAMHYAEAYVYDAQNEFKLFKNAGSYPEYYRLYQNNKALTGWTENRMGFIPDTSSFLTVVSTYSAYYIIPQKGKACFANQVIFQDDAPKIYGELARIIYYNKEHKRCCIYINGNGQIVYQPDHDTSGSFQKFSRKKLGHKLAGKKA
jgi:hypothetical protein